eukprot:9874831-Alexandrium_andersonii.AAC.1
MIDIISCPCDRLVSRLPSEAAGLLRGLIGCQPVPGGPSGKWLQTLFSGSSRPGHSVPLCALNPMATTGSVN